VTSATFSRSRLAEACRSSRSAPKLERLTGAKEGHGGASIGMSDSATISMNRRLDDRAAYLLRAAERVAGEPSLRADLDTWRQATLESDGPARFITYYRIYEAEAAALLAEEPRLLSDDPVERCLHALPDGLGRDERERLQNSVGDALRKVRARSRPQVLAETVGAAKPGGATGRCRPRRFDP
jgi:hypothetical protein